MGIFWETQGHKTAEYASEMQGWETSEKLQAMILLEHVSEMPGWETFGKLKAIILPECVYGMSG